MSLQQKYPMSLANASSHVATPCSELLTCDDCIKTYTCHFCEQDLQCHAIGSTSGCIKGMSTCHHIQDCVRPDPQIVGYGPPAYVVLGVLVLVATLLCCCCSCSMLIQMIQRARGRSARRRSGKAMRTDDNDSTTALLSTVDEEATDGGGLDPALAPTPVVSTGSVESGGGSGGGIRSILSRFLWLGSFVALTVLALMYYPRIPDYEICNQQFDWESTFLSLTNPLHPQVKYDVIISVINENRFAFDVEYAKADISHNGIKVGTWSISNWTAEAGAVSDMLTPVMIEPATYVEAWSLLSDFRANNLTFQLKTNLSGSIRWGSFKLYDFTVVAPDTDFLVGSKLPRDLCKCSEYLTPTNATKLVTRV
ncbi:Aste57867_2255 [Aphanomyces stellatus]|uniref:Aste57867_2255 protein n=1 Tax=Aphanomyces stellatus TaxID=120398 RepID=A0A485K7V4_9STRA|nr:hypothetical protein As57867_002250 [Aphanomyces stellatus]VFT79458.1 Aste57867_2255 [Aphanomyces stellatus]